jgi:YD repeat-containing protein
MPAPSSVRSIVSRLIGAASRPISWFGYRGARRARARHAACSIGHLLDWRDLLVVGLLLTPASRAAAQETPEVSVSPGFGTHVSTSSATIEVDACADNDMGSTQTVTVNGTNYTAIGGRGAGGLGCELSSGVWTVSVTLQPGQNSVDVQVCDWLGNCGFGSTSITYDAPQPALSVSADQPSISWNEDTGGGTSFTVLNTGNVSGLVDFAVSCGGALSDCGGTAGNVSWSQSLNIGDRLSVPAGFIAGEGTSGTITLSASFHDYPTAGGSATTTITLTVPPPPPAADVSSGSATVPAGSQSVTFSVDNHFGASYDYSLSADCGSFSACSISPASLHLGIGESQDVTVSFTTVGSSSTVSLSAENCVASQCSTGTGSIVVSVAGAQQFSALVTPNPGSVSLPAGTTSGTANFAVKNTSTNTGQQQTFNVVAWCSGAVSCSGSSTLAPLSEGQSASYPVQYTVGAGSGGTVTLTVSSTKVSATAGLQNVTIAGAPPPPPPAITVSPSSETVPAIVSSNGTATFTITSNETTAEAIGYHIICSGAAVQCRDTAGFTDGRVGSLSTAGPASATVSVLYHVSAGHGGTGTLTLSALGISNLAAAASGTRTIAVNDTSHVFADVRSVNAGPVMARDRCVTIAVAKDAAYECGDLRLVHALPTTTTMNKARTPTLIYNSRLASGKVLIAANVGVAPGVSPTSIVATVQILSNGGGVWTQTSQTFPWTSGNTRSPVSRIVVPVTVPGTSMNNYVFQVQALAGTVTLGTFTDTGTVISVFRGYSQFGPGWWLDGLEQIYQRTPTSNEVFWVGGDGSARAYTRVPGTHTYVVTPTVDRPDTLTQDPATFHWKRHLRNGAYVDFNSGGQQDSTRDVEGATTTFAYDSLDMISSISLPAPPFRTSEYTFETSVDENFGFVGAYVVAPQLPMNIRQSQIWNDVADNQYFITDVDNSGLRYTYDALKRITSRSDRLGHLTVFTYDPVAGTLASDTIRMAPGQPAVVSRFCAAEAIGAISVTGTATPCPGGPVDTTLVRTLYDGPRTDVSDTTGFYVNRFGEPSKIVDALGGRTSIERTNQGFPLLATAVVEANGHRVETTYNDRGLPATSTDVNLRDSTLAQSPDNARTTYTWDGTCDRVTSITIPSGDVTSMTYNHPSCTMATRQDPRGASTAVTFTYDPSSNLLTDILYPDTPGGATEHFTYDISLGNLSSIRTPGGVTTTIGRDWVGRDTLKRWPEEMRQVG